MPSCVFASGLLMLAIAAVAFGEEPAAPLRITLKRSDDRSVVTVEKRTVVVTIDSPFGISQATLEPSAGKWPEGIVVRLRSKGLENFHITNGTVRLEGAASIEDGKPKVRQWKDGKEDETLDAKNPYWVDLGILDATGKPATRLPLDRGIFELRLPKVLLEGETKSITVKWIDFYR